MNFIDKNLETCNNFIFLGEAGSGKSEIAINFAIYLKKHTKKEVHFFDMDMTKPLFRSRDLEKELSDLNIVMHYEKQFMDAPTIVGGVRRNLKNRDAYVVMDIGGDYMGARAIGGFASEINKDNCLTYYVVNPYRPWSTNIEGIDKVLSSILGVSHVKIDKVKIVSNPNLGISTTLDDIIIGNEKVFEMIGEYKPIEFLCVSKNIYSDVIGKVSSEVFPIDLFLTYPWE